MSFSHIIRVKGFILETIKLTKRQKQSLPVIIQGINYMVLKSQKFASVILVSRPVMTLKASNIVNLVFCKDLIGL